VCRPTGALSSLISVRTRQLTPQRTPSMLLSSATHTDSQVWWVKAVSRTTCFAYSLARRQMSSKLTSCISNKRSQRRRKSLDHIPSQRQNQFVTKDPIYHTTNSEHIYEIQDVPYKTQPNDQTRINTETSLQEAATPLQ
jgi:hypothetical protein